MIATQPVKILVIDDHEVVRRGVKQILEETFLTGRSRRSR